MSKGIYRVQKGFTLIELIIVITIIGILAAVVTSIVDIRGTQNRAKDSLRQDNLNKIAYALEAYYSAEGEYPSYDEVKGVDADDSQFRSFYMSEWPDDEPEGAVYDYYAPDPSNNQIYGLLVIKEDSISGNEECYKRLSGWNSTRECAKDTCDLTSAECDLAGGSSTPPSSDPFCTEDDGGKNPNIYSCTEDLTGEMCDTCTTSTGLREWYCLGNEKLDTIMTCSYVCTGGKCESAPEPDPFCTENDGGNNPDVYSCTEDLLGEKCDLCNSPTNLQEWYCSGTSKTSTTASCTYGCTSGKCDAAPAPSCTESDGGNDPYVYSCTTDAGGTKCDACSFGTYMTEWYCSGETKTSAFVNCAEGCTSGQCNSAPEPDPFCNEDDGGNNPDMYSCTEDLNGSACDSCTTSTTLQEWYCSGTSKVSTTINCPSACTSGECEELGPEPETCTDTDGQSTNTKGTTISSVTGTHYDSCYDTKTVTEWYCDGNVATSMRIGCGSYRSCNDGKCVFSFP